MVFPRGAVVVYTTSRNQSALVLARQWRCIDTFRKEADVAALCVFP